MALLPKPRSLAYGGAMPENPLELERKRRLGLATEPLAPNAVGLNLPGTTPAAPPDTLATVATTAPPAAKPKSIGGMSSATGAAVGAGLTAVGGIASSVGEGMKPNQISGQVEPGGTDYLADIRAEAAKRRELDKKTSQAAATAIGAVNPVIGGIVAVGSGISDGIKESNVDEMGFRKTDAGGNVKDAIAGGIFHPSGSTMEAIQNLKDDDYSTAQKVVGFLPGVGSFFTGSAIDKKRERAKQQMQQAGIAYAAKQTRQTYGGLPGGFRRGGLLPRRLAVGGQVGEPPVKKPVPVGAPPVAASAPPARYTIQNPSPQARQYYQNILPTMAKMTGGKYNETYIDPATGKSCAGNSCLAFANSALEVATGQKTIDDAYSKPVPRSREMAYNPEFTKRSQELGWERIPLGQAQAGDRLQYWNANGNMANGVDREADTGKNNYLPGKYPAHMMVFGGWKGEVGKDNQRAGVVYNDGHEFENADRMVRTDINPQEFVAYRYIGVGGQPTNDPKQAVAVNPAAPAVALRAKGGLMPTQKPPSNPLVKAARAVLPINAAMYLQDLVGNKTPLTNADLKDAEINALRAAARKKGASGTSINENDYKTDYAQSSLRQKLRNPDTRMATTIGGATLRKAGPGNNTQLTDRFDYNEYSADDKTGREFEFGTLLKRNGMYSKLRYLGGVFGSADGEGAPVKVNLGNLKRPRAGEFKAGGLLPRSVIATGALHSETNQHVGHPTAGKRGIPVLDATGAKLAEVERDEWTLHDAATKKLESLRNGGSLLALGKHVQRELLTNTIPSPRYAKRLLPS